MIWIFAQGHVSQVEQPSRFQVVWKFVQLLGQKFCGLAGAALDFVNAVAPDRHQTRIDGVIGQTILLFAQPEECNRQEMPKRTACLAAEIDPTGPGKGIKPRELLDRLPAFACQQQLRGIPGIQVEDFGPFVERVRRREQLVQLLAKQIRPFAIQVKVVPRVALRGDFLKTLGHLFCPRRLVRSGTKTGTTKNHCTQEDEPAGEGKNPLSLQSESSAHSKGRP